MGIHDQLRSKVESYFKNRFSKKEENLMEQYWEEYFVEGFDRVEDNMHTFTATDRNSDSRELRDMRQAADDISDFAEEKGISSQALAAFCFEELFEEAAEEFKEADGRFVDRGNNWGNISMPSDDELKQIREGEIKLTENVIHRYQLSKNKFIICEEIVSSYGLAGGTESIESFINLIEERQEKLKVLENLLHEDVKKAEKSLQDLRDEIGQEQDQIDNKVKSVTEGSLNSWFGE